MGLSQKVVVKIDLHDDRGKQKAVKAVASLTGIDSISVDMKEQKIVVTGSIDPVDLVTRLRKCSRADILSVGPAKEEKKEEPKKEEEKKEEPKKEEEKKQEPKKEEEKKEEKKEEPKKTEEKKEEKKEEEKKEEPKKEKREEERAKELINEHPTAAELVRAYRAYNPHMTTYYYVQSAEENPNSCAII